MSDHGSTDENAIGISSENAEGEVSEIQPLTQEAVNEQIRGFIAPVTRQLEELTRVVQGMTTTRHPNHYPRTEFGTTSGTAISQSDNRTIKDLAVDEKRNRELKQFKQYPFTYNQRYSMD